MTGHQEQIYGIKLTSEQILEVSELFQELKEAGLLLDKENMGMFMAQCFYRGFTEYKKDVSDDE